MNYRNRRSPDLIFSIGLMVVTLVVVLVLAFLFPSHGTAARIDGYYPSERGERVSCVVTGRYQQSKNIWRSELTCKAVK